MDPTLLQRTALEIAAAREVDAVLDLLVDGIAAQEGVALARIWLRAPGDLCAECSFAASCPDRTSCLHLVASAGSSRRLDGPRWAGTGGAFRRFPLGVRKVGRIGATGISLVLDPADGDWLADPAWAADERIVAFAGHPLLFRDEVLGVLAVFSREPLTHECVTWLRTLADHAAIALANARAFEEVQRLRTQLQLERDDLRQELSEARRHGAILGGSAAMRRIGEQIAMVADSDAPVLVLGESGTGKELIATAIHEASPRRDGPMVRVNCAAIPSDLFESEFFGHTRGAFTGATADRAGRFQVADGGTLLLDEVGEIPLELQGKLLRAIQERQFSPVGSDRVHEVDVRIVAATNRDLKAEVTAGRFREDLYYRLAVFPLEVPPLRERKEDIPALATRFLRLIASRRDAPGPVLRRSDVAALQAYDWPGNVRELQNVIERAVILGSPRRLRIELEPGGRDRPRAPIDDAAGGDPPIPTEAERLERMRRDIRRALERCGGRVSGPDGAAALLGLKPSTLASRRKALGV